MNIVRDFLSLSQQDLALIFIIALIFIAVTIYIILPALHKHFDHLKIGENEFKFREYKSFTGPSAKEIIEEVKKVAHDEDALKDIYFLLSEHFIQNKDDLFWLATMFEKYAFSFAISKNDISEFYYQRLVWTLARYRANDHIINTLAEQTDKMDEVTHKLNEIIDFHKPYIEVITGKIPEKYKNTH